MTFSPEINIDLDTKADLTSQGGVLVSSQLPDLSLDTKADLTQSGGVLVSSQVPDLGLDTKADLTQAGGVVVSSQLSFDPDEKADLTQPGGVLVTSQLPAISITSINVVADQTARLNLTAEEGDVAVQTDTGEAYILSTNDPTVDSNWVEITIDVLSQIGGQQITPAQVGTSSNQATIVADSVTESGNNVVTSPSADRDIFVIASGASDPAAADADDIILEKS